MVRAGLEPAVTGAIIETVTVFDERSLRRHPGPSEDFIQRLTGRRILAAVRRGKFLWLPLSGEDANSGGLAGSGLAGCGAAGSGDEPEALVAHLGMTGQMLLRETPLPEDRLLRVGLHLDSPAKGKIRLDFVDQRIFGSMAIDQMVATADGQSAGLGHSAALIPSQVAHISRDPLDPAFSDRIFLKALGARRTGIKRALLDQKLISGVGNIYADEALWAAKIHYAQPTASLSAAKASRLLAEVRAVLIRALAEGGTSFDSQYVNVNGASGYFSHSLQAYGRQGQTCSRCTRKIVRESFMNRGSHFCPFCQKIRPA